MLLENDLKLDFSNVLLRPKRSTAESRKDVNLWRSMKFRNSEGEFYGVPIMAANMDGVGTLEMAEILSSNGMFTCLNKPISEEDLINHFSTDSKLPSNYTAMTIGATKREEDKFASVYEKTDRNIKFLCIDVANGYTEYFSHFVYGMRSTYPDLTIIAGNVVTADMTQELIINGADIVKVGIGPGSVCTTRIQTGVGYPQLSAVIECADAAHGLGAHVIADGGCSSPGDIAKAFGGGADFVMLGGMLAGHDQGGGEVIDNTVRFYGMSSETANDKHFGGLRDYRAAEGKEVKIPYKGDVRNTVQDILGSLRSTCTYIGAKRLKDIPKCATFIRCSDTHNRVYE
tara:strand:+ start:309 stop:1337 length:1029 start_codon:yes stop_codon:yes gene_type:complete